MDTKQANSALQGVGDHVDNAKSALLEGFQNGEVTADQVVDRVAQLDNITDTAARILGLSEAPTRGGSKETK